MAAVAVCLTGWLCAGVACKQLGGLHAYQWLLLLKHLRSVQGHRHQEQHTSHKTQSLHMSYGTGHTL